MIKNSQINVTQLLKQQATLKPPVDLFDTIMDEVHDKRKNRYALIPAIAIAVSLVFGFLLFKSFDARQINQELVLLEDKIAQIEAYVINDYVNHSEPGSELLEKMVSIENWLDRLDVSIMQSEDEDQKLELMHAKLDMLGDLVALQRKAKSQSQGKQII